jgi:hypothetical protein
VVEITVSWGVELECTEADIVKSFIVDTESLVGVLNKLVDGEGSVVWLDNGVGDLYVSLQYQNAGEGRMTPTHLWRGNDGESAHHPVGVFLPDLRDQECTHTGTSTTTKRVGDLETLQAVGGFGFTSNDIKNGVYQFGTLSVVTFRPIVTGTTLPEDAEVRLLFT